MLEVSKLQLLDSMQTAEHGGGLRPWLRSDTGLWRRQSAAEKAISLTHEHRKIEGAI